MYLDRDSIYILANSLAECPNMRNQHIWNDIKDGLPKNIRDNIHGYTTTKAAIINLLSVCNNYEGGIESLLEIVREYEGNSKSMKQVDLVWQKIKESLVRNITPEQTNAPTPLSEISNFKNSAAVYTKLKKFLLKSYNYYEILDLAHSLPASINIPDSLPGSSASLSTVVHEFVDLIERHRLHKVLIKLLRTTRPNRINEIDDIESSTTHI